MIAVESRFLEPPRETEIGSRNVEFEILGVKLQWNKSKGNDFWFKLFFFFFWEIEGLRNRDSTVHVFDNICCFVPFCSIKAKTPSLHMADDTIVITPDLLHVDHVAEIVGAPSAGAISLFVGKLIELIVGNCLI